MTKWLSDLAHPISLTVSKDGQLAVLRNDETSIELDICGSNGSFLNRIVLLNSVCSKLTSLNLYNIYYTISIVNINNSFVVVSAHGFQQPEAFCRAYDFSLFSINSLASNGQLIGQVNHII